MMMFTGAFIYSFIIGSLSSLISKTETELAKYNQKLNILLLIKKEYKITDMLYAKTKMSLKFGNK